MELQRDLVTTTLLDCVKSGLAGKPSMPLHMLARLRPSSEAGGLICKWPFWIRAMSLVAMRLGVYGAWCSRMVGASAIGRVSVRLLRPKNTQSGRPVW